MSQVLQAGGLIDAGAWSEALAAAIRSRFACGAADTSETYYAAMTDALETLLAIDSKELDAMMEAWRQAYMSTPHGQPVSLAARYDNDDTA